MRRLLIALSCFITVNIYSQSITNTLGTSGLFSIKDATNNYLTLSQSTGQVNILRSLKLENTANSNTGVMYKGIDWFLHNYGTNNIFLGAISGNFIMTGYGNIGIGGYTLYYNTTGFDNTAIGNKSLVGNTSGNNNTALGSWSLNSNYNGNENTALGSYSLTGNYSGINNTAIGSFSLSNNFGGANNTAVGCQSMNFNNSGFNNTAVGYNSLLYNTGNYNTALGYNAGSTITTGANLTCLGIDAAPSTATAIDQVTLGNGFVQSLRCNVQTISSLSDMRDKKNITDLTLGLDFLMKVKPRQFNWDKREWYEGNKSDGSKMKETPTAGFISQELDEVQTNENADWLNLVLKDNPEKLEATYGNLLPVMVKAIQELKAEKDELKNENNEMKQRLLNLEQTQNLLVRKLEMLKSDDKEINQVKSGGVK
ncbi:MAG: tail fiber domain-containing protein [Ignavibacteria bacterium]|nr:tail fiber domain-containing protein [Ignavibacteria bacterium]